MPRRVTSSDGGGRLDILLSLRIGGGACPAGGVGDFTTCIVANFSKDFLGTNHAH